MSLEQRYGPLAAAGAVEPPFGICYLAAMARDTGYEAQIVDAEALGFGWQETFREIMGRRPDLVGFTATTPAIPSARLVAEAIKRENPTIPIVLGGVHATAIPEETLKETDAFDIIVVGEGEITLVELLEALRRGRDLSEVAGLVYRVRSSQTHIGQQDDCQIVRTQPRGLVRDLDTLPEPAFDLLPSLTAYYRVTTQSVNRLPALSLITSRGCYAECTFCDTNVTGRTMRAHSAAYVIRMMRRLRRRYGVRCVMFEDDNFLAFRKRLREMGELMQDEKLDMTWSCTSRVDIAHAETLQLAKRLGCWQVLYGVESGSQRILDFYRKRIKLEETAQAMELSKRAGLYTKGFVIIGNPCETIETLEETRRFLLRIALDDISITYFTPYPGAEVYRSVERYGTLVKQRWDALTCFEIVFIPHGLSAEILEEYQRKIFREFYFRPKVLWGYLGRIKSVDHAKDLLKSGVGLLRHTLTQPSQLSYCIR